MSSLFDSLSQGTSPLFETVANNWIYLAVAFVGLLVVVYLIITQAIQLTARWREARGWRKPLSFMALYLFKVKGKIMANREIREFYEPGVEHIEELGEKEHIVPTAWLSEHPVAARASIKKTKIPKGHKLNVRKQIRELGDWIRVRDLPDFVTVAGDKRLHFFVELSYQGKDEDAVERLGKFVKTELKAHSIQRVNTKSQSSMAFVVHMEEPLSVLTEKAIGAEFYEEHPATSWSSYPLAFDEEGNVVSIPLTHILIYGMTGSGKGSPFNGIIRQSVKGILSGMVKIYIADAKESEGLPWEFSSLVEDTAYTADNVIVMISHLYDLLLARNAAKRHSISFEEGKEDLKRRLKPDKENPVIIFMIDELLTLILELRQKGAAGKAAESKLAQIMALGRSSNIFLVAATQVIEKEILGRMRDNFVYAITLRNQASKDMNEIFLGEGAIDRGFDPRKIIESTEDNDYATSGMAYVKGPTGDPKLVRFAYMSDKDIAKLVREHPKSKEPEREYEDDFSEDGDFAISDEGEQLPELETFELNDFDEPLPRA
ncbi:hypothetical protein EDF24_0714 [Curtobacterium sp. PhB130]|uniref:type IV secretory system conjugative DNA transfer family protein n=1 Tax=Curtobacterium sp. PhB130 TaxID=2485178 RepID=UPI000F4B8662|nr:hypothetical protein [Curtobacterium sp. PhB130]ROS77945.1 hypothetical protein EDF24_0714 [Curtobacterium sp. PhB130]